MVDTIQRKFTRSKVFKRIMRIYCRHNGITGGQAVICEIMQEITEAYSDNQIRDICRYLLQCDDIREAEKEELLHFLCIV